MVRRVAFGLVWHIAWMGFEGADAELHHGHAVLC